jgi:nucleotide-binding universal stress UspA family protein
MLDQSFVNDLARRLELEDATDFIAGVLNRLRKGEREYADNPAADRPMEEIMAEVVEEAEDVGGWVSRAWEGVPREPISPAAAEHARRMLIDMVVDGHRIRAKAHLYLEFLEDARREAPTVPEPPVTCLDTP